MEVQPHKYGRMSFDADVFTTFTCFTWLTIVFLIVSGETETRTLQTFQSQPASTMLMGQNPGT